MVPALSAQIAACSQIAVLVSTLTCSLSRVTDAAGSISWPCLQSGVGPGFESGWLLGQSWPSLSGHSGEWEGESGPAPEPMHYFTQQVTGPAHRHKCQQTPGCQ